MLLSNKMSPLCFIMTGIIWSITFPFSDILATTICQKELNYSEQFVYSNLDSAYYYTKKASECFRLEGNFEYYLSCKVGLCNLLFTHKKFDKFLILCAEVEDESSEIQDSTNKVFIEINNTLGNYYRVLGKYEISQRKFENSLKFAIFHNLGKTIQSVLHHNIGANLLEKGDLSRAQRHINLCLELRNDLPKSHLDLGHIYELLGDIQIANLDYLNATNNYERALSIYEINNAQSIALDLRLKMIKNYLRLNNQTEIDQILKNINSSLSIGNIDSLNIQLSFLGIKKNEISSEKLKNIFLQIDKMNVPFFRKSYLLKLGILILEINKPDLISKHIYQELYQKIISNTEHKKTFIVRTLEFLFKDLEHEIENSRTFSLEKFDRIANLMSVEHSEVSDLYSKKKLSKIKSDFQENVLGKNELNLSKDLVLEIFDLNKAYSLSNKIEIEEFKNENDNITRSRNKIDSLIKENRILSKELSKLALNSQIFYNKNLTLLRNKNMVDSIQNKLNIRRNKKEALTRNKLILGELQQRLTAEEMLLSYVQTDSVLYQLLISKNSFQIIPNNIHNKDYKKKINDLLYSINCYNTDTELHRQRLYDVLFEDIKENTEGAKSLIIIPDGDLNKLPFKLILKSKGSEPMVISRQLSMRSFIESRTNTTEKKNQKTGIISGIDAEKFPFLRNLPCAEGEINGIRNMIMAKNKEVKSMTQREDYDWDYNLIHISSHSAADTSNFYGNRIFLDDIELNNVDIENLDITAQLVTISSCESGVGEYIEGEGSISLARAFFQAGASAAIVSLWPVDDCSTAELMKHFYEHLLKGERVDEALNNAQIDFLAVSHPKYKHPIYWSSFVHIGDPSPVFPPSKKPMTLPLVLALGAILSLPFLAKAFSSKVKSAA